MSSVRFEVILVSLATGRTGSGIADGAVAAAALESEHVKPTNSLFDSTTCAYTAYVLIREIGAFAEGTH